MTKQQCKDSNPIVNDLVRIIKRYKKYIYNSMTAGERSKATTLTVVSKSKTYMYAHLKVSVK